MKIDLSTLLNGRVNKLDIDYSFLPEERDDFAILPDNITLIAPIKVEGQIVDKNGYLSLACKVFIQYKTNCDRCLAEVDKSYEFVFERIVASSSRVVLDDMIDEDDVIYVNDGFLSFDKELVEEIALELPTYHLCKDDCLGLCFKCGKNLNNGPCECKEVKEIDPRLIKLKQLLDSQLS